MSTSRRGCAQRALELQRLVRAEYAAKVTEAGAALEAAKAALLEARTPEERAAARARLITARAVLRSLT